MTPITTQKNRDQGKLSQQQSGIDLNTRFADEARRWADLKVQYRHRGTTERGCDCTGMLVGIAKKLGFLRGYNLRMYPQDWNLHAAAGNFLCEELDRFGDVIPNSDARNGDVAIFRFGKCLAHAGVIVNLKSKIFVHSFLTSGKCQYGILRDSIWSKRWVKTYRLNNGKMELYS